MGKTISTLTRDGEYPASMSIKNRELTLAMGRIGKTAVEQLQWLIDFAATDLDALSAGRLADLGWEVVAFSLEQAQESIPIERIRDFQEALKKGLDDFFSGKGWEMTTPEVVERLKLNERPSVKGYTPERVRYAFNLVKAEWQRLQLCSNSKCRKRFVVKKRNHIGSSNHTRYCSPRCSNYTRVTAHRLRWTA